MNDMTRGYLTAALWLATDGEAGEIQLDRTHSLDDIAPASVAKAEADCAAFLARVTPADQATYTEALNRPGEWSGEEHMGHDFWLTRNRHGVGFWDRGLGDLGERLTELAHSFGETDLYLGDDGKLYLTGGER